MEALQRGWDKNLTIMFNNVKSELTIYKWGNFRKKMETCGKDGNAEIKKK